MFLIKTCDKGTLENSGMLNCYKMCNKAVDNYAHALEFLPDCYNTQKMCNKAVNTSLSAQLFVPGFL